MPLSLRLRLSGMMFLQYFMFGSWLVTLGTYMSKSLHLDAHIGTAYGMQGFATIVSTLVVGALADRLMAAQKLLGILSILSALTLWLMGEATTSGTFLAAIALHFLCFVPTIPLATSIALNAIPDRAGQFPGIRVWGTAGWIAAGVVIGMIPGAGLGKLPLQLGALAGLLLGLYAFTLPSLPPAASGSALRLADLLGLQMIRELRQRDFAVFIAGVLVVLLPLGFYNTYCNNFLAEVGARIDYIGHVFEPAAIQALGQVSEVAFLLVLPLFLRRFGVKGVLIIGMFAWALRYACFALAAPGAALTMPLLVSGVLLHGVCYDFFFVAGQIYVDGRFGAEHRARAQAFLVFINMGVGVVIASNLANWIYGLYTAADGRHDWQMIWAIPGIVALCAGVFFIGLFKVAEPPRERAGSAILRS
jgi:nucleoside transporter